MKSMFRPVFLRRFCSAVYPNGLAFLGLLALSLSLCGRTQAGLISGDWTVVSTAGTPAIISPGGATRDASPGVIVNPGDRIVTGPGETIQIDLPDGSRLGIGERSEIVLDVDILAPEDSRGILSRVIMGALRWCTGFITSLNPDRFGISPGYGGGGIRGTVVDVWVPQDPTEAAFIRLHPRSTGHVLEYWPVAWDDFGPEIFTDPDNRGWPTLDFDASVVAAAAAGSTVFDYLFGTAGPSMSVTEGGYGFLFSPDGNVSVSELPDVADFWVMPAGPKCTPEPSAIGLMALAGGLLCLWRRTRGKQ